MLIMSFYTLQSSFNLTFNFSCQGISHVIPAYNNQTIIKTMPIKQKHTQHISLNPALLAEFVVWQTQLVGIGV